MTELYELGCCDCGCKCNLLEIRNAILGKTCKDNKLHWWVQQIGEYQYQHNVVCDSCGQKLSEVLK